MGENRIYMLIGTINWTNKREIMYVSRLKRKGEYKISNRNNRQSIHIAEEGVHNFSRFLHAGEVELLRAQRIVG